MCFIKQGKTNIKYLFILIIAAIFAGGIMVGTFKLMKCSYWWPSTENIGDQTAGWQVLKNEEFGFEMKYPREFFQTEVLQPTTAVMDCDYANFANKCPFIPIPGFTGTEEEAMKQGFATSERTTINNMSFCLQKITEGALGTTYITYNYTTVRKAKCFTISFTVPYPNCQNYLPVENQEMQKAYDDCILANEITKPQTIQRMLSTFRFVE